MKVKHYNLHLDFLEHMRSLTALEYVPIVLRRFNFESASFKLALFPRILRLRRFWESSTSRYLRRIWLPPTDFDILPMELWPFIVFARPYNPEHPCLE